MEPYVLLEKAVGQTPLECAELFRASRPDLAGVPLAYAGRLDPMASGQLLVLIGEECKVQTDYHHLDKQYEFSVLLDVASDSGDILGVVTEIEPHAPAQLDWKNFTKELEGRVTLPYPHYSSKTVQGKPLHTWAVEGKLGEITIPTKTSSVYSLKYTGSSHYSRGELYEAAITKIALLPTVTDPRKALGNDFRRPDVLSSWKTLAESGNPNDVFSIASFTCIASSGTYMRTLADELAKKVGSRGLAFSIHRTKIGVYQQLWKSFGWWKKVYR